MDKNQKIPAIVQILLAVALVLAVNFAAANFYKRVDLTKEGRFSLTDSTKELLSKIDEPITFKVYLEGEFPAGMKRLRDATRDMLEEFRSYAGNNIEYEFIDPLAVEDEDKKAVFEQLVKKGLRPERLIEQKEGYSEKMFFPGALSIYRGRELPVDLLEEQLGANPLEVINNSIGLLEFKLANVVQKAILNQRQQIAFTTGNGELPQERVNGIASELGPYFEMVRFNMNNVDIIPSKYDLLVVAKPTEKFSELQKFKIDQYLMQGGKILWMIDQMGAELDSLRNPESAFFAMPRDLGLEDVLFKYGVRLNDNLVQDRSCNPIPIPTSVDKAGNATQFHPFDWYYFPILMPGDQSHPIAKNLGPIASEFCSTIDTIRTKGIKKNIILTTTPNCKLQYHPVKVDLNIIKQKINPELFRKGRQPVAVALEGEFESVFKNRLALETMALIDSLDKVKRREISEPTKMVVVADGDIIKNELDRKTGKPLPLGLNTYSNQTFANKGFLINAIEWLLDDHGIVDARNKEVKMRLLNPELIESEEGYWQLFNIAIPLLIVFVLGLGYTFVRRKRYT